ncbi:MAG: phosphoribosylglycinamide formyltransferase [Bacteroidota bacterium]
MEMLSKPSGNIAIFASGTGSNALKIIEFFKEEASVNIVLIASNKPSASVLNYGEEFDIETLVFDREYFYKSEKIVEKLQAFEVDMIVLAGFLWLVPGYLVQQFPGRIINIHPALLPKYGGKGMYGMNVHRAVKAANEPTSGITIHYVNEKYDEGSIIFQADCALNSSDTPEMIAKKVLKLEHYYFPRVIKSLLSQKPEGDG